MVTRSWREGRPGIGSTVVPVRPSPSPVTVLGVEIRRRRLEASLGQAALARLVGLPRSTLAGIERGSRFPSYATAGAIAPWLGWSVREVFDAAAEHTRTQGTRP
jgi:DNA-binding XRE family transcriptional regulator